MIIVMMTLAFLVDRLNAFMISLIIVVINIDGSDDKTPPLNSVIQSPSWPVATTLENVGKW